MDWFLYDNGLRHERVNYLNYEKEETTTAWLFTLQRITTQNGQTDFKNLPAFATRILKCIWPFWDVMH